MNSAKTSSSEHFLQHLKSVGGSESDVETVDYVPTDDDTVESVASHLRIEQQQHGFDPKDQAVLHASAQLLVSRRDENDPEHHTGASLPGEYQLDIHVSAGSTTREAIPAADIADAKVWARARIEARGAEFGAIYFPAGGSGAPGTGDLVSSFDRAVGWYR